MAEEIAELADDIGLPVEMLQDLLPRDNPFVDRLVEMGYDEVSANEVSFIGDLRNVIILMRSHGVSARKAANLLRQTPESPFESDSTEDISSSSSSDDETTEAKKLKLDPDYVPSTASEGTLSAANSQEPSEEEEEKEEKPLSEETETEEEGSWHPSRSTSPEVISSPEDD